MAGAQFFNRWGDWIRSGIILGAVAASHFLDTRYVAKQDYAADKQVAESASRSMQTSLDTIRTALALQEQQLKMLNDHESRLRAIEFGRRVSSNN